MEHIIFTVTNALNHDQRMIRICNSLSAAGYTVTLVGVQDALPLRDRPYHQKRLPVWCRKGFAFYAEYNIRLFFYLLFARGDRFCCIDLDTILPVWLASVLRGKPRIYDAHEFFSEQKEVISRPGVHRVWKWIEKKFVPRFPDGYTVSRSIAAEFTKRYGVTYAVIRNMPFARTVPLASRPTPELPVILYQGAVNEARGLESLIPAMQTVPAVLHIYGDGNLMEKTKEIIRANNLQDKVLLKGKVLPGELEEVTRNAHIGINLVEPVGLNQYYSLANKFFDYIQQGIPQLTMDFPEYRTINNAYGVAVLIDDTTEEKITDGLLSLLRDRELYQRLRNNCIEAAKKLNWQEEEKQLLLFYHRLTKKNA